MRRAFCSSVSRRTFFAGFDGLVSVVLVSVFGSVVVAGAAGATYGIVHASSSQNTSIASPTFPGGSP